MDGVGPGLILAGGRWTRFIPETMGKKVGMETEGEHRVERSESGAPTLSLTLAERALRPLAFRSMFLRPQYLTETPWLAHLPFLFWLVEAFRPRDAVHLAADEGVAFLGLCQAVDRLALGTKCLAVPGPKRASPSWQRVREEAEGRYGFFARIAPDGSAEAAATVPDSSIDLFTVEATGFDGAGVSHLWEIWQGRFSERALVLLHASEAGTLRASDRDFLASLRSQHPHFLFPQGLGLLLLGVGSALPDSLSCFFSVSPTEAREVAGSIREVFGRLGQAVRDAGRTATLAERVRQLEDINHRSFPPEEPPTMQTALAGNLPASALDGMIRGPEERVHYEQKLEQLEAEKAELDQDLRRTLARAQEAEENERDRIRTHAEAESARLEAERALEQVRQAHAEAEEARVREARARREAEEGREQLQEEKRLWEISRHRLEESRDHLTDSLDQRLDEMNRLSRLLVQSEEQRQMERRAAGRAIGETIRLLSRIPGTGVPRASQRRGLAQRLRQGGLFDPEWYLSTYPDVSAAGVEAFEHYLRHGIAEGRWPRDLSTFSPEGDSSTPAD